MRLKSSIASKHSLIIFWKYDMTGYKHCYSWFGVLNICLYINCNTILNTRGMRKYIYGVHQNRIVALGNEMKINL